MSISYSTPSIHGVGGLRARVLEFTGSYCLLLTLCCADDGFDEDLGIWFTGPDARERVHAYVDAINSAAFQLPTNIGASA